MNKVALIVAGGSGTRMGSELPKQFLLLKGKPILMHSILKFYEYDKSMEIIVVLPESQLTQWNDLCKQHNFSINHRVTKGGNSRFESVKNGLEFVPSNVIVAIHDGVRPLVSINTIANCFNAAAEFGNAIPVIPLNDSIRILESNGTSKHSDRANYRLVQTPQCFKSEGIKKAYEVNFKESFTDDASVIENSGQQVHLVAGNPENTKITHPHDLRIAEALIQ